jgi:hypothetical protein
MESVDIGLMNLTVEKRVEVSEEVSSRVTILSEWAATSGVKLLTGDFNGDFNMDIALIRQEGGWGSMPIAATLQKRKALY